MRGRLLWRSVQNSPLIFLIPVIVAWVIVPLAAWSAYRSGNLPESGRRLVMAAQALVPVTSLLWPLAYLPMWIESEGKEALFASRMHKSSLCPEVLLLSGGFVLLLLPALLVVPAGMAVSPYEVVRLAIQIIFGMGFVYCFSMLLNSVSMSATIVIVYLLFSILFSADLYTAPYCLVQPHVMIKSAEDLIRRPVFLILAIISFPVGFICERTIQRKY